MNLSSISFFTSGTCFGAVVGVLLGYMAFSDEQREARMRDAATQQAQSSPASAPASAGHQHGGHFAQLRFPEGIEQEVQAAVARMKSEGSEGMDMIMALIGRWKEALKEDPQQLRIALKLASLYAMVGKFEGAAEYLARAVEIETSAENLLLLAQALYHGKNWPAAAEYAEQAAKRAPGNAFAHELLIVAAFQAKDLPRARDAGARALEVVSDPEGRARIQRRLEGLSR